MDQGIYHIFLRSLWPARASKACLAYTREFAVSEFYDYLGPLDFDFVHTTPTSSLFAANSTSVGLYFIYDHSSCDSCLRWVRTSELLLTSRFDRTTATQHLCTYSTVWNEMRPPANKIPSRSIPTTPIPSYLLILNFAVGASERFNNQQVGTNLLLLWFQWQIELGPIEGGFH